MRGLLFGILFGMFICAVGAIAANENPPYLSVVNGTLVESLSLEDSFQLHPGTISDCTKSDTADWTLYLCKVTGAVAEVAANKMLYRFDSLRVLVTVSNGAPVTDYTFTGEWSNGKANALTSKTRLELYYYNSTPSVIRGTLSLLDLGIEAKIQAKQ